MSETAEQIAEKLLNTMENNTKEAAALIDNKNLIVCTVLKAFKQKPSITLDDLILLLEKEKEEEQGRLGKARVEEAIKLLLSQK